MSDELNKKIDIIYWFACVKYELITGNIKSIKNMAKDLVKTEINVIDNKIGIMRVGDVDYISLTDLARYADAEEPRLLIRDWMRNKEVISYLGLWESMNNKNFKGANSLPLKMKQAVINLKCHHKNGLKKLMQSELFQNQEDMMVEHLHILILHLNLLVG